VRRDTWQRRLADSNLCLCDKATIPDRGPSTDEFEGALEEAMEQLDVENICEAGATLERTRQLRHHHRERALLPFRLNSDPTSS
jgi:hypothetical protein